MARYIDADALIPMMKYATTDNEVGIFPIRIGFNDIVKVINDMSAADVRENVRGIITYTYHSEELWGQSAICNLCGCKWQIADEDSDYNFCPNCGCSMSNCGSDMRGEKDGKI